MKRASGDGDGASAGVENDGRKLDARPWPCCDCDCASCIPATPPSVLPLPPPMPLDSDARRIFFAEPITGALIGSELAAPLMVVPAARGLAAALCVALLAPLAVDLTVRFMNACFSCLIHSLRSSAYCVCSRRPVGCALDSTEKQRDEGRDDVDGKLNSALDLPLTIKEK